MFLLKIISTRNLFVKAIFVLFKTFLKTLLNRKKIPCIPPVLRDDKCCWFSRKKRFPIRFCWATSQISKESALPSKLPLQIDSTSCHITKIDFLVKISNLDPNKAHGHDKTSIHLFKICGVSICRLLNIIFKTCLYISKFP